MSGGIWGLFQELQLACAGDGLRAAVDLQFGVQMLQMPLDGAGRNDELAGDRCIRLAAGQQAQHGQLAGVEGLDQRLRRGRAGCCRS